MAFRMAAADGRAKRGRPRKNDTDKRPQAVRWGETIRILRETQAFLYQAEFAKRVAELSGVDCDQRTVSKWETGEREPALHYRAAICEILEVPGTILFAPVADQRAA